ncbi:MAG: hypothetical protein ABIB98_00080 [bacterium]
MVWNPIEPLVRWSKVWTTIKNFWDRIQMWVLAVLTIVILGLLGLGIPEAESAVPENVLQGTDIYLTEETDIHAIVRGCVASFDVHLLNLETGQEMIQPSGVKSGDLAWFYNVAPGRWSMWTDVPWWYFVFTFVAENESTDTVEVLFDLRWQEDVRRVRLPLIL